MVHKSICENEWRLSHLKCLLSGQMMTMIKKKSSIEYVEKMDINSSSEVQNSLFRGN